MIFEPGLSTPLTEDKSVLLICREARLDRSLQITASMEAWNGERLHQNEFRPGREAERNRFIKGVVKKHDLDPRVIETAILDLTETIRKELAKPKEPKEEVRAQESDIEILDMAPPMFRRPLSIIENKAYAATWVYLKETKKQGVDSEGNIINYSKPIVESYRTLWVVSETGDVYGEKGSRGLDEIDFQIGLTNVPPVSESKLWSAQGVKRFQKGDKPAARDVFSALTETVDRFIDFDHSLADQKTMCELIACYALSTWFLDAFNVIGYLWPNGEKGSGKTQLLNIVSELSYLGQMILAGGSYSSLRDLADAGATLCFDEAENVASNNNPDDDKKALLLAGNRRGSTVTFKELSPDGKTWQNRFVNTFCARAFSAINMPNGALEDRTTIIPLIRSVDRFRSNADVLDFALWPHDRQRLIDDLWALGLTHLRELKKADDYVAAHARLTGRNLEPFRSSLAVAKWMSEKGVAGLYERMEQLTVDYQSERRGFDSGDLRVLIVRALVALTGGDACDACDALIEGAYPDDKIKTSSIREALLAIAEAEEIFSKTDWITPSKVGKSLQKMRFTHARIAHTGQKAWLVTFKELARWKKSLGIKGDSLKQASQASQASPLYDNSTDDSNKLCDACKNQASPSEPVTFEAAPPETSDAEEF
jgi:hypothetical protein